MHYVYDPLTKQWFGDWMKTPWYLRLIGYPKQRRRVFEGDAAKFNAKHFLGWEYAL